MSEMSEYITLNYREVVRKLLKYIDKNVEARARIELAWTDLQSAASPLRHRASLWCEQAYSKALLKEQSLSGL